MTRSTQKTEIRKMNSLVENGSKNETKKYGGQPTIDLKMTQMSTDTGTEKKGTKFRLIALEGNPYFPTVKKKSLQNLNLQTTPKCTVYKFPQDHIAITDSNMRA